MPLSPRRKLRRIGPDARDEGLSSSSFAAAATSANRGDRLQDVMDGVVRTGRAAAAASATTMSAASAAAAAEAEAAKRSRGVAGTAPADDRARGLADFLDQLTNVATAMKEPLLLPRLAELCVQLLRAGGVRVTRAYKILEWVDAEIDERTQMQGCVTVAVSFPQDALGSTAGIFRTGAASSQAQRHSALVNLCLISM